MASALLAERGIFPLTFTKDLSFFRFPYSWKDKFPPHFQDLDPLETLVDVLDEKIGCDRQLMPDMCQLVASVNEEVNQDMEGEREFIQRGILDEVFTREDVVGHQAKYLAAIEEIMTYPGAENAVFAFPMNGALAILEELRLNSVSLDRLFPVWIAGSRGTETGFAEFLKPPPDQVLDLQKPVIFADDVLDTCVTAIRLALKRLEKAGGKIEERFLQLPKQIGDSRKGNEKKRFDDPDMKELYQTAAELMKKAGVVIAPLYSKDVAMQEALSKLADDTLKGNPYDSWNMMQKRTVEAATSVPEEYWIMGGRGDWFYPLLDLGFKSEDLLEAINSQNSSYAAKLKEWGFENMKLRLFAGARNLLRLRDSHKLQQLIVKALVEYMDFREGIEQSST